MEMIFTWALYFKQILGYPIKKDIWNTAFCEVKLERVPDEYSYDNLSGAVSNYF